MRVRFIIRLANIRPLSYPIIRKEYNQKRTSTVRQIVVNKRSGSKQCWICAILIRKRDIAIQSSKWKKITIANRCGNR